MIEISSNKTYPSSNRTCLQQAGTDLTDLANKCEFVFISRSVDPYLFVGLVGYLPVNVF